MPTGSIMIVEDESLVAEDLESILSGAGFEVVGIADNFGDAKLMAEQKHPDLALLDIRLKGTHDGIDLANELRRHNIGFVYLTSHGDEGTLARAEVTEPLGYVLKPFGAREMLPVLQTAMYRHAAEVRLRGVEEWLRTTLRSIGDGVVVTDQDCRVTFMNPVAEQLTQRGLQHVLGHSLVQVLPLCDGDTKAALPCMAARAMSARAIVHVEPGAELLRADGSRLPIDDSAAPVRGRDDSVTGAVIVLRDATPRRLLEQQRREADKRMQDAEKLHSLNVMASGLAHDLNNILTVILGGAALCRSQAAPGSDEILRQVEDNAKAASELCRRMLVGVGAGPIVPEAVDMGAVVHAVVASERATAGPQLVITEVAEQPGLHVMGDPLQLRQVLTNLVRNAVEAKDGREGHVVVRWGKLFLPSRYLPANSLARTLPPGEYIWFEVADDGPGMAPDVLARVFEPFFTTKVKGRGLGLAGVHGIVRRHGGAIDVNSELGLGTSLLVFWPKAGAPAASSPPTTNKSEVAGIAGSVLVVDDEELVRHVIRGILSSRGWQCHDASSGARALELLRGGLVVDAVVLDMMMPDTEGGEVLVKMRRLQPELPILVVSGNSYFQGVSREDPAIGFLPKPFGANDLVARLQKLLRARR